MAEKKQTDENLHGYLTGLGFKEHEPNQYGSNQQIFDNIETDGEYYRVNGGPWKKR